MSNFHRSSLGSRRHVHRRTRWWDFLPSHQHANCIHSKPWKLIQSITKVFKSLSRAFLSAALWIGERSIGMWVRCLRHSALSMEQSRRHWKTIPDHPNVFSVSFHSALLCCVCLMFNAFRWTVFLCFFCSHSSVLLFHVCIYGFLKSHFPSLLLFFPSFGFMLCCFFCALLCDASIKSYRVFLLPLRETLRLFVVWDGLRATCRNYVRENWNCETFMQIEVNVRYDCRTVTGWRCSSSFLKFNAFENLLLAD